MTANGITKVDLSKTVARLMEIAQFTHSLIPKEEEEWLGLTGILRDIRDREYRKKEDLEKEGLEEVSVAESIAANYGVARSVTDAAWGKGRN